MHILPGSHQPFRSFPLRIVSLAPSVTSILLSIGAGRHLVGVSKWCHDVANVGRRPTVGDCWKLDVDEVARLHPTHVIGSVPFATEAVEKILRQPFIFIALNPRSLADMETDILTLGRLTGKIPQSRLLVARMRGSFLRIADRARKLLGRSLPCRVYSEAWPNPRISSPPWVAELIALTCGKMCVPPGSRVTDSDVAASSPDVILLAWTATGPRSRVSTVLDNPRWRGVPAVVHRRVFAIRDEWLNTPGPPLVFGARAILRALAASKGRT
ncbi:MAG TPA: ABC transporter substrate-binding protein [Candidatus Acidoferrum sp.]|nr:ABC transporter substrate-binding protein [Candidatus Acidoferrum sp.]